jgi:hypothetical protein
VGFISLCSYGVEMKEPNEREAFEKLALINESDIRLCADGTYANYETENFWLWFKDGMQHQQKRIDEVSAENRLFVILTKSLKDDIESLQAKLNVAVEALEYYSQNLKLKHMPDTAKYALAEINKIGE